MAIDVCLEGAGWLALMVDTGATDLARLFGRRNGPTPAAAANQRADATVAADPMDRRQRVRTVAADLPIDQAQAIWLVDVCGYRYDDAADLLNVDRSAVAERVAAGRRTISASVRGPEPLRQRVR